ncbi:MAG: tRNA (guanosine(37)-N1)-methyltransferase TrmD [Candidatus Electryoneaceae bacterium]|nr:tRNA (guanosine(37)-N1)-methyltransferase TrmD [Candidatus Electryoneaceae bacterium]
MGLKVEIVTLFPHFFDGVFTESMMGRAQKFGAVDIVIHDLRRYATDKHHQADGYLYGGGAGMLLKPEPLFRVLKEITETADIRPLIIYPTPQGKSFQQADADRLAHHHHLIFLCGHYKGIDQRVVERWVDREYSLGDFVVTGGEIAVTAMVDSIVRLLPGVLGDFDSARTDSFRSDRLDCPHYTRPEEFEELAVPSVLMSGHHRNIEHWRRIMAKLLTKRRRPDLLKKNKQNSEKV